MGLSWQSLDPSSPTFAGKLAPIMAAIYGSLLVQEDDGNVRPGLATSYDYGEGGTSLSLTLQPDLQFTDGTPLDAEAVKFNFDRILSSEGTGAVALPGVTSVTTEGELTVVLHLDEPNYSLHAEFAGGGGASYIGSPTAIQAKGDQFGNEPVGAGPFALVSHTVGSEVRLERNEDYVSGAPYLDGLEFTNLSNAQQAYNGLKTGAFNYFYQAEAQWVQNAEGDPNISTLDPPDPGFFYIVFNATKAPFDSREERRAAVSAIDQSALSSSVFYGQNQPTQSFSPPGTWSSPGEAVEGYPEYDPDAVRSLPEGLEFTLNYGSLDTTLATAVANQMSDAGLNVELEALDHAALFDRYGSRSYDALLYSFTTVQDPNGISARLFQSSAPFSGGISNSAIDQLVQRAVGVESQQERAEVYGELATEIAEEAPLAYLGSSPLAHLTTSDLHDVSNVLITNDFDKAWLDQ